MSEMIEATDRYGGNWPDPSTVCEGQCDGMGMFPAYDPAYDVRAGEPDHCMPAKDDAEMIRQAGVTPGPDGYAFLKCRDCGGTGKKP